MPVCVCVSSKGICVTQGTQAVWLVAKLAVCLSEISFVFDVCFPIRPRKPIFSCGEHENENQSATGIVADVTFRGLTKGPEQSVHQSERKNRAA